MWSSWILSQRSGGKTSCQALAAVSSCAVHSICFFVFAGFSRAESLEGGGFVHSDLRWGGGVPYGRTPPVCLSVALLVDDQLAGHVGDPTCPAAALIRTRLINPHEAPQKIQLVHRR